MTNSTIGNRTASSRTASALHSRTTSAITLEEPALILEEQFSPRFEEGVDLPAIPETVQEDNATLQVLEKTAILKTQILADYQVPNLLCVVVFTISDFHSLCRMK
jgi:hypothetical protein